MPELTPTPEDLARDLAADLALCGAANARNFSCLTASRAAWPAAIRRALAAEAEAARLRRELAGISPELRRIAALENQTQGGVS